MPLSPIVKPLPEVRDLKRAVDALCDRARMLEILEGETIFRNVTSNGTTVEVKQKFSGASSRIKQYRVKSLLADALICNTYSVDSTGVETVGTEEIQVARPWDLRYSTWNGKTVDNRQYTVSGISYTGRATRLLGSPTASASPLFNEYFPAQTAPAAAIVINEKIWPEYIPNQSIIYVLDTGTTQVYENAEAGILSNISLIDVNLAARKWEMIWHAITVCMDNGDGTSSNKRVLIRSSETFT